MLEIAANLSAAVAMAWSVFAAFSAESPSLSPPATSATACGLPPKPEPPPKPSFQSSVEVTSLDVAVVDDRGKPVPNLSASDFVVRRRQFFRA